MVPSSLAPNLLVAMPQLADPNFRRAVVLLIHHDANGTFGVVLNRPTDITAPSLCAALEIDWRGDPAEAIDWGGPVQPQSGWLLFDDDDEPADVDVSTEGLGLEEVTTVAPGIHFAGSLDVLRRVAQRPPPDLRMLIGYAGWGPGQLEAELAQGAWLLVPASREVVFGLEHDLMWDHVVRSLGIEPATLVSTSGVH